MKRIAIIVAFLLCKSNLFAQSKDSLVLYTKNLQWSSFKGASDRDTLGARISTSIYLEVLKIKFWTGALHFKAYALMDPAKSWFKPGYADPYTLQHEQTHFNITEMCARALQTELNQLKLKSKKSDLIQSELTKWQNKLEVLQKQYDLETRGGNDPAAQKKWNEKIIAELNSTD